MNVLIIFWIAVAVVGACVSPLVFDEIEVLSDLGGEGRAVVGIVAAIVWPLFLLLGVLWLVRAFCIGLAQVWRLFVPAKSKLPKARVRR